MAKASLSDTSKPARRVAHKLTAAEVRSRREPGKYGDGGGLWLIVSTPERRSWAFRYMREGRAREMSLGSVDSVSLAEAREKATEARRLLAQGLDPLTQREASRAVPVPAAVVTFADAAERFINAKEAGWRNSKHRQQWRNTLGTYATPIIGTKAAAAVDTADLLRVLEPIWTAKPETAVRVRGRIEAVLDYAKVQGWREGPNPAVWRGHLQLALPARAKVRAVEHHAALPWPEMPAFMAQLRAREGIGARALEFAILTAARSGEVRGARWVEIDQARAVWTIPADRMKAGKPHRVPLSAPALAVLAAMADLRDDKDGSGTLVFPGQRQGRPLSDMSLTAVLRRLNRADLTAHGFRSTFRDWCSEATDFPGAVAEMALAHAIGSGVEAAYRRGDLFSKRAELMAAWAIYCGSAAAEKQAAD